VNTSLEALHGIRLSDWISRTGISRSAAYELLRICQIEPEPRKLPDIRKPVSHLLPEHLEVLEPLARQLKDGATLPQIREQVAKQSGIVPFNPEPSGIVPTRPEQSGQLQVIQALADAMNRSTAPSDPLRHARALAEAADLAVALSSAELGEVVGLEAKTVNKWPDGHSPRPGFTVRRQQAREGGPIWWFIERAGQSGTIPHTARTGGGSKGRQVGFGAVIEASYRVIDTTGSRIFAMNQLSGRS
jgi:hypothetical protein